MIRRPVGFWTKGKGLEIITSHVRGKTSEAQAVEALRKECPVVDEKSTLESVVRWYARDVRKALGLPSLRETASAAKAKQELAQQK